MRLQITLLLFTASLPLLAESDQTMDELFKKYGQVMDQKKTELVDEVFSEKFLRDNGGREHFISKVKAMPLDKDGEVSSKVSWKKGVRSEVFLAKLLPYETNLLQEHGSEFIVVKEGGKLKINGTSSDAD